MSRRTILCITIAGVLLTSSAAFAARVGTVSLPDGEYLCSLNPTMQLGSIWIHGDSYIGPSRDPNGPSHPFRLTSAGTIEWGAPMGGMDTDGNRVVGTVLRDARDGRNGFDIQFQTETGHMHIASCGPV